MAVKPSLQNALAKSRDWAVDRWGAFRAESPYFQAKVGMVAAYLLVVALTVLLAPPSSAPWDAKQQRIDFGAAFKTVLEITNADNGELEDVVIEVNGTGLEFDGRKVPGQWSTRPMTLIEGLPTKILTEQLYDKNGLNPPYSLVIETVTVRDDDNEVLVTLHPPVAKQP